MNKLTRKDKTWLRSARKKVIKDNKAFERATNREKRVMIAQDNISLLLTGAVTAQTGHYLIVSAKKGALKIKPDDQVQALLGNTKSRSFPSCTLCAIGGAMMSTIRLGNNVTFKELGELTGNREEIAEAVDGANCFETGWGGGENGDEGGVPPWVKIFGGDMLREMEKVFEGHDYCPMSRIPDSNIRMFAIMENIIENKGKFKQMKDFGDDRDEDAYHKGLAKRFKDLMKIARSKSN